MTASAPTSARYRGTDIVYGLLIVLLAVAVTGIASSVSQRDALRRIVQQQCIPDWLAHADPAPCVALDTAVTHSALLHDAKGGAHYLLIPTDRVTGIESPLAWQSSSLNYFDTAWRARAALEREVHHPLTRDRVGLAINSRDARSQDQLHIHIECLRPAVSRALAEASMGVPGHWQHIRVYGFDFALLRLAGEQLGARNPLALVASTLTAPASQMAHTTVLVAGAQFADGPGFFVLAGRWVPGSSALLESDCGP